MTPGFYRFECTVEGNPTPLPFEAVIETAAVNPPLSRGVPSTLTTQLRYDFYAPDVIAPGDMSMLAEVRAVISLSGATPTTIEHTAVGLPSFPWLVVESESTTTELTPRPEASVVDVTLVEFSFLVTNLNEQFVPGGQLEVVPGEGGCSELQRVDCSEPIELSIEAAP